MIRLTASFAALLLLGSAAFAGTTVAVAPFTGISANSGAEVTLIYGPTQRVTLIAGDLKRGRIQIRGGNTLEVSGCTGWCWGHHALHVEVVTPRIASVVAHSGGGVRAVGNFPRQPYLYVQAHSGGEADLTAIPADTVEVLAHSGGEARVKVLWTLNAKAHSGGDVHYVGRPAHINSQANSGGDVSGE